MDLTSGLYPLAIPPSITVAHFIPRSSGWIGVAPWTDENVLPMSKVQFSQRWQMVGGDGRLRRVSSGEGDSYVAVNRRCGGWRGSVSCRRPTRTHSRSSPAGAMVERGVAWHRRSRAHSKSLPAGAMGCGCWFIAAKAPHSQAPVASGEEEEAYSATATRRRPCCETV